MPAGRKLPTVTKNRNYPQLVKDVKPMALGPAGTPQSARSVWTRRYPYVSSESSNDFFTYKASIPRLFAAADSGAFRHP